MYCRFCGHEIENDALFCSSCGKNQTIATAKPADTSGQPPKTRIGRIGTFINQKIIANKTLVAILLLISLFLVFLHIHNTSNSIEGDWMAGTDKITFAEAGEFKFDGDYGTYTVTTDKTLKLQYGYYSFHSGTCTYKWGKAAEWDPDYWYISNGVLYFRGTKYYKK